MQPHGRSMFQSTHSLRSATGIGDSFRKQYKCFNPRTPCGVRQMGVRLGIRRVLFQSTHSLRSATALDDLDMISMWVSIHALLAECDFWLLLGLNCSTWFQSTHSLRSATRESGEMRTIDIVSIHALLAECDLVTVSAKMTRESFNPRTPCGVRPSNLLSPA